jgi:hypothetical protein
LPTFGSLYQMTDDPEPRESRRGRRLPVKTMVFSSAAGVVIMPAALFLGWTLRPTGGWLAALAYGVVVWLAVVMCATAVTLAVRAGDRRVRVALLAVVAVVLVCGLPSLTFATFAVDYGPAGAECESCAVIDYLG